MTNVYVSDARPRLFLYDKEVLNAENVSVDLNQIQLNAIANVPGMTAIALQASLQTSHRSMPNSILSAPGTSRPTS